MRRIQSVLRVASVTTAAVYAFAGIGFALATLVMGRVLSPDQFAAAILLIALCNVGVGTAPAGLNGVVVRHDLRADARLLLACSVVALVAAIVIALVGHLVYAFNGWPIAMLFLAVLTGGIALAAASSLQRAHHFQKMALLTQSANLGLFVASLLMVGGVGRFSWFPVAFVAMFFPVVAVIAWGWVLRQPKARDSLGIGMWRDAVNFGGVAFGGEVMVQVERFLIPLVLSTYDLAVFAVLASVAVAPYRVLEMGAGSTLPAQLRRARNIAEQRRLLCRDVTWLAILGIFGGLLILAIGPYVCRYVLPDAEFPWPLMQAAVVSGIARVCAAVANGLAGAFCAGRELQWVHAAGWAGVGVAIGCGYLLAEFGLPGLIYGVACGWLFRAAIIFGICSKYLWSRCAASE